MRLFQWTLLVVGSSLLLYFGIVPAFSKIDSDFPNYYTSARLVVEGGNLTNLYDDAWFQKQIEREGIDQEGRFSPFPPVDAFIMIPLAYLPPRYALQAWTIVNVLLLGANVLLLSRILGRDRLWSALLFLGSGIALVNNFRLGQFYLALSLLLLAGYLYWRKARSGRSGSLLGAAAALKYFPVLFLPLFIVRKEWKLIFSFLLTILILYALSVLVLGIEVHRQYLRVLTSHLDGNIQDGYSATFQSWNSLLKRIFVRDPAWNPEPLVGWPPGYILIKFAIYGIVAFLTFRACRDAAASLGSNAPSVQFALVSIAGLLLLPASATYHFLLLVLPVGLLLSVERAPWRLKQKMILGLFILIGFIPYRIFRVFDGRALLTILAYPRLALMVAIFLASISYVRKQGHRGGQPGNQGRETSSLTM
ncbi:MAG TPA: glycosyltransferase family 87 protein [Bacteroidota bacterium]|nr:glycosyltransferase family 87 protein [Bacteroidota bacterium]